MLTKDFAGFKIQPSVEIRVSPEAGIEDSRANPYAWVSAVESVLLSAHFRRSSEPSRKGFSFLRADMRFYRCRRGREDGSSENCPDRISGTFLLILVVPIRRLLNGNLRKLAEGSLDHITGQKLTVNRGQTDLAHQRQKPRFMKR